MKLCDETAARMLMFHIADTTEGTTRKGNSGWTLTAALVLCAVAGIVMAGL